MTKAAPIRTNCWLVDDDAASHSDRLNGTMYGNRIKAIPEIPDMRTAAYVVAINKVGTSYAELGIFP